MPTNLDSHHRDAPLHDVALDAARERRTDARAVVIARVMQVVDYLFGALYVLIGFEFALEIFAARDGNAVKRVLDTLADPFIGPFRTLLPTLVVGKSEVIFSYVVALLVYATLHLGLRRLARIVSTPSPL